MFYSNRWSVFWIAASLFCAGCGGNAGSISPLPSSSPAPPIVFGRGSVAVIEGSSRILVAEPNADKFTRDFTLPGGSANSLAFDRRGHLYVGIVNHDEYFVREMDARDGKRLRLITLKPGWDHSSVATDDHNVLYVNTKSFIGGDIKLFRPEDVDKPYLEIKDPLTPLTILVARESLWVGYQGAFADALARDRLRSTQQTWFTNVGVYLGGHPAINPAATLIAAKVRRHGKGTVTVYPLDNPNRWKVVHEGDTQALASDDSGNLYIAQRKSRILLCTFSECPHSFETNLDITALALSPVDGMLYVATNGATNGKPGVYVYNPRTTSLVRYIPMARGNSPNRLAIEP